ncbi:hypothetical protein ACFYYH_02555 [Streptomyces sp. NPDC002018]|uniref:hypothetical protein n=1 Tax=Streptomyces sp. NPDC002018 TaxID=3364629 RepID=UPI0036A91438
MALALVLTPATTTAGQTFTATATATPAVLGEPITFQYDAQPNQTVNANAGGVAVATFTATTTGPVVAVGATSGTAVATQTVTAATGCAITVTSTPANPAAGQPVTLTTHVTCNGVEVDGAVVALTTPNGPFFSITAGGLGASVNIGALPLGINPITATVVAFTGLPPTCLCIGTTVTTSVTVGSTAACTVAVTSSPATPTLGQPVTLTATVTCGGAPVVGAAVVITGPGGLSFTGTTNASGQATTTTSSLPAGANTITATVNAVGGTCTCVNVVATGTVTVGAAQGFTARPACYTLNFPPLPWSFAHTTLTVTGATPGAVVTFHSDGAGGPVLCTAVADVNGNASCPVNLTVFQLASGFTATTPVPGGFLTSSSTLSPCI